MRLPRPPQPAHTRLFGLGAALLVGILVERWGLPHSPLDPIPRTGWALALTLGLALPLAWGMERWRPRAGVRGVVSLWLVYAFTEGAHMLGGSAWLATAAAIPLVALAWRWPMGGLILVPLVTASVGVLRPLPPEATARGTGTRLLLVTVDTLRADSSFFTEAGFADAPDWMTTTAVAAAPWTPPSMTSLWLGEPVQVHGGGVEHAGRVSLPHQGWDNALPMRWNAHGAVAEAVVSNPHLRHAAGFGAGFTRFWHHDAARERHLILHTLDATWARVTGHQTWRDETRDVRVVRHAVARLQAPDAPDLLWVHLLDPHEHRHFRGATPKAAYRSAVSSAAVNVRALVEAAPGATVVVVGDHGESLGEGGRWGHGRHPTAEVLEVPLAIRHPPTAARPTPESATLVGLGRWLAALANDPDLPFTGGGVHSISGVRGQPEAVWTWDPLMRVVRASDASVSIGPLAAPPSQAVRASLEALGYLEPSH